MGVTSFKARPLSYRVSAILAVLFGLMLAVGVASPYWHQSSGGSTYGGLWSRCDAEAGECFDRTADASEDWWVWAQVLETLGLLCVTMCCGVILFENCFSDNSPFLLQELLGMLGGLLGLIGCIIFVVKTESRSDSIYATCAWSFYFAILGAAVVFITSFVILIGGKTAHKSLRLKRADGHISPEPVRRFSHLWARESPATPEGARKALGSAQSRDGGATSFPPPPKNLKPLCETSGAAELGEGMGVDDNN